MVQTFDLGLDDIKQEHVDEPLKRSPTKRRRTASPSKSPNKRTMDIFLKEENGDEDAAEGFLIEKELTRLVIGIDFGTTYSGVAFARSIAAAGSANVITRWDESGDNRDKVPTTLALMPCTDDGTEEWGYGIKPHTQSLSWFKLGMAGEDLAVPQDDPLLNQALGKCLLRVPDGMNAEDLCKEYLGYLHGHAMQEIQNAMTKALLESTRIEYVLTTPADWGQPYKAKLKALARDAGIAAKAGDTITTLDEPEAAALAAFASSQELAEDLFEVGINIVVVDMGGGTVDVITYAVAKTDPLRVKETCAGSSARCGGTTIDRALHELMSQKYGTAFSRKKPEDIGHGSIFMKYFESIKRTFDASKEKYRLPLPMTGSARNSPGYDKISGDIILTKGEIVEMFGKVLSPTFELLSHQVKRSTEENGRCVKLIVLCGGLSGSPWVQKSMEEFKDAELELDARQIIPLSPWSAIARGAVTHGLNPKGTVESRKCRWSYGICVHQKFDPAVDGEDDAFECPVNGKRAFGHMKWHAKREQTIKGARIVYINAYVTLDKRGKTSIGDIQLYKCKDANPPSKVDKPGVEPLGKLKLDMSGLSKHKDVVRRALFKNTSLNVQTKLAIKIGHRLNPAKDEVEFIVKHERTQIGHAVFEYEPAKE